jgi:hypothetical protein
VGALPGSQAPADVCVLAGWPQHNRGHIVDFVMKPYRIGECSEETMAAITAETVYEADDVYGGNPEPYPDLLVNTRYPCACACVPPPLPPPPPLPLPLRCRRGLAGARPRGC